MQPRQQVGVVRVHQRVAAAWRQAPPRDRRPRPRRVGGDVDHQLVAPVPVDLRRRHPPAAEVAGLHRVLGVEAIDDRHGAAGVAAPPGRRVVLRRGVEPTSRHAGQVHLRRRARTRPVPALALEVLVERVAEQVGVRRRRWTRRSRTPARPRRPAPDGTPAGSASTRRTSPATFAPAPTRARRADVGRTS